MTPVEVIMPRLGLTMTQGKVVKWLKGVGDAVRAGEPLAEISTEKVTSVVEAPVSGVLREICVAAGGTAPVLAPIAVIDEASATAGESPTGVGGAAGIKASPLAVKLAEEKGVDLRLVPGSGPGGRILREDVVRYLEQRERAGSAGPALAAGGGPTQVRAEGEPLDDLRATMARRMLESVTTTAQWTAMRLVSADGLVQLRGALKEAGRPVSVTAVLVMAAARSLVSHPEINVSLAGDRLVKHREVNIGVAVDAGYGLVVPVVRRADARDLFELHACIEDLAARARARTLGPDELTGGTFTVSNLGMMGIDFFTPILNPPESALLGVGRVFESLTWRQGRVEPCWRMFLSLTTDHRIIDGATASRFLATLASFVENPVSLLCGRTAG